MIYDNIQRTRLGAIRYQFESYYEVRFLVDATGWTETLPHISTYQEGSWEVMDSLKKTGTLMPGAITFDFYYDENPNEVSWVFAKEGSKSPLHFQPFNSGVQQEAILSYTFGNLESGEYYIKLADAGGDGVWGSDKNKIFMHDDVQQVTLDTIRHHFEKYYEVRFLVASDGWTEIIDKSSTYQEGIWEVMDIMDTLEINSPQVLGSITLKFQYDEHPEDISWVFAKEGSSTSLHFQPFLSNIEPNAELSYTFGNLESGEYYLKVADAGGDGIWGDNKNKIMMYDNIQRTRLGAIRYQFESYYEVRFLVDANGWTETLPHISTYEEGSWEVMDGLLESLP